MGHNFGANDDVCVYFCNDILMILFVVIMMILYRVQEMIVLVD